MPKFTALALRRVSGGTSRGGTPKTSAAVTRTVAEVFGVPPLLVPPEMRRNAKAVNFGIVYGQSAFGLAAQLGIPQSEAQKYIQGYFERYAGVKLFIDRQIAEVRRIGETRTLFGRRRPIPEINSGNANPVSYTHLTL